MKKIISNFSLLLPVSLTLLINIWAKLIYEKNLKLKISCQTPFKWRLRVFIEAVRGRVEALRTPLKAKRL
jgi:hypothetical protein